MEMNYVAAFYSICYFLSLFFVREHHEGIFVRQAQSSVQGYVAEVVRQWLVSRADHPLNVISHTYFLDASLAEHP